MENYSEYTWVLVYDPETKRVISIIEPGLKTSTKFTLMEFGTQAELYKFIEDSNLINEESN